MNVWVHTCVLSAQASILYLLSVKYISVKVLFTDIITLAFTILIVHTDMNPSSNPLMSYCARGRSFPLSDVDADTGGDPIKVYICDQIMQNNCKLQQNNHDIFHFP